VAAGPDAVFDVLADPRSYARWVVGSKQIRAADGRAPVDRRSRLLFFNPLTEP
jgi:hypothetical protein